MKKTTMPPSLLQKGLIRYPELLPFSRATDRGIHSVLRATPSRVRPSHRGDFKAVTRSQFGRYQVVHKLGQGAMSAVFLARDPVLARLVAIKVLHADRMLQKEVVRRFFQEAKVAARSQSPHIVNVHDLGQAGQAPYLVMEFIDGQPLQKIMDYMGGEPLPPIVSASLLCQAAEGTSIAAEAGIVHRDLKPANLMVSDKGYLKITDFGICHLSEHTLTRTGQVVGSPRFMSPEQVKGLKPISPQADLFSLGAVLYYCLSGKPPFQADTPVELYRQIVEEPHPPLEEYGLELDPFLIHLVDTLLEKDPAKRGQGPRWLRFQLKRYLYHQKVIDPVERVAVFVRDLSGQGYQTTSDISPEQVRQWLGSLNLKPRQGWSGRRKAATVFLGVLLAGGVVLSLYFFLPVRSYTENGTAHHELEEVAKPILSAEKGHDSVWVVKEPIANRMLIAEPESTTSPIEPAEKINPFALGDTAASDAVVSIHTAPPFAEVTIDGQAFGRTPLEGRTFPAGRLRITLKPKVGKTIDTVLTLRPGPQVHKFTLLNNPENPRHEND